MAFGVKWNKNGEEGEPSVRPVAAPGRGAPQPPDAAPAPGVRMRRLPAGHGDSILPLGPRQDGKGEEGEGRSRQPFSLPAPNTHTHALPGRRSAGSPAPCARPAGARGGGGGEPPGRPSRGARRTHTPSPSSPRPSPAVAPGKRPPPPGEVPLTAQPGRLVFGGSTRGAGSATQSRGSAAAGASQAPGGGDGRQSVWRGRGDSSGAGLGARSARPAAVAAPPAPPPASRLPLRPGSALRSDGLRAVRPPASPPPAPPPAAAAALSPLAVRGRWLRCGR